MAFYKLPVALSILILISCLACNNRGENKGSTTNNFIPGTELISDQVESFLKSTFSGWSIVDTADYAVAWWSFYERDKIPYAVVTDLNDDQHLDYGVILKKQDSLRLVILTNSGDSFWHYVVDDIQGYTDQKIHGLQVGLSNEAPGQIDCVIQNKPQSIILKSNGITLTNLEIKSRLYYYENDTLRMFRLN